MSRGPGRTLSAVDKFICRNGPVISYAELKGLLGVKVF
jgi:hypothetical protein